MVNVSKSDVELAIFLERQARPDAAFLYKRFSCNRRPGRGPYPAAIIFKKTYPRERHSQASSKAPKPT